MSVAVVNTWNWSDTNNSVFTRTLGFTPTAGNTVYVFGFHNASITIAFGRGKDFTELTGLGATWEWVGNAIEPSGFAGVGSGWISVWRGTACDGSSTAITWPAGVGGFVGGYVVEVSGDAEVFAAVHQSDTNATSSPVGPVLGALDGDLLIYAVNGTYGSTTTWSSPGAPWTTSFDLNNTTIGSNMHIQAGYRVVTAGDYSFTQTSSAVATRSHIVIGIRATVNSYPLAQGDPTTISGLVADLDPAQLATAEGGSVTAVPDRANNYPLSRTTGTAPTFAGGGISGAPALVFDNNGGIATAAGLAALTPPFTLVAVTVPDPREFYANEGRTYWDATLGDTGRLGAASVDVTNVWSIRNTPSVIQKLATTAPLRPQVYTLVMRASGNNSEFRRNGLLKYAKDLAETVTTFRPITLGTDEAGTATQYLRGRIGRFLIYNRELSRTELAQVEGALVTAYETWDEGPQQIGSATANTSLTSIGIAKPNVLVPGCHIIASVANDGGTITPPAGFSLLAQGTGTGVGVSIYKKYLVDAAAVAAEPASSTWTQQNAVGMGIGYAVFANLDDTGLAASSASGSGASGTTVTFPSLTTTNHRGIMLVATAVASGSGAMRPNNAQGMQSLVNTTQRQMFLDGMWLNWPGATPTVTYTANTTVNYAGTTIVVKPKKKGSTPIILPSVAGYSGWGVVI